MIQHQKTNTVQDTMIKNNFNELLKRSNKTKYRIQKDARIDFKTLQKIAENDSTSISFKVLDGLCRALNCTVGELFEYVPDSSEKGN